jgi:hypothetical protein
MNTWTAACCEMQLAHVLCFGVSTVNKVSAPLLHFSCFGCCTVFARHTSNNPLHKWVVGASCLFAVCSCKSCCIARRLCVYCRPTRGTTWLVGAHHTAAIVLVPMCLHVVWPVETVGSVASACRALGMCAWAVPRLRAGCVTSWVRTASGVEARHADRSRM